MKKRYAKWALGLFAMLVLFAACSNPIMNKWWTNNDSSKTTTPSTGDYFIVSFNPDTTDLDATGKTIWVGPQAIIYGGTVAQPAPITKAGYAFGGWYPSLTRSGDEWDLRNRNRRVEMILIQVDLDQ